MRRICVRLAALSVAVVAAGCVAAEAPSPSPSVVASAVVPSVSETPQQASEEAPEPSLEAAPTVSPSPIVAPSPQGGPWSEVGVTVTSADQLSTVEGLPESFKDFLATRFGAEDDAGCRTTEVDLKAVHRDGFVFGAEDSTCGSSFAVWGILEERWHYVVAFDDALTCRELTGAEIPVGVPGLRCVGDDGKASHY